MQEDDHADNGLGNGWVHHAAVGPALSIIDMPEPKGRFAPKTFKGKFSEIRAFLDAFERLCERCNVALGRDRCDTVRRYCGSDVVAVIEGLASFHEGNWADLKAELLDLYDADRDERRYSLKDLRCFVKRQVRKKIGSTGAFKEYQRSFMAIGGWLYSKDKISKG